MPHNATGSKSRPVLSSTLLESQLLDAPHRPEALARVVGCIWSSLVYAAAADTTTDGAGALHPLSSSTSPPPPPAPLQTSGAAEHGDGGEGAVADGPQQHLVPSAAGASPSAVTWEAPNLSPEPSLGASPLRHQGSSTNATSGHGEPVTPYLEHTLAGRPLNSGVGGFSDGEEGGSHSLGTNFDATMTAATNAGHSFLTTMTASTAPSSVADWSLQSGRAAVTTPVAQLSPLVLRLLLWWACQPQLPPAHTAAAIGTTAAVSLVGASGSGVDNAASAAGGETWVPPKGFLTNSSSSSSDFVASLQRQQREAQESHQLRLRIAEIFSLLCRRGYGVVVSDALVYGRCHDASEAAATRCNLIFAPCSHAMWRAATTTATYGSATGANAAVTATVSATSPNSVSVSTTVMQIPCDAFPHGGVHKADPNEAAGAAAAAAGRYDVEALLRSLLRVHTLQYGAVDADVSAAGLLLRALLRCPRLHKRVVRSLLTSDRAPAALRGPVFRNATSTTLLSSPNMGPQADGSRLTLVTQATESDDDTMAPARVTLAAFLPALTHASPVISAEAWQTLGVLLFPSARMSSATRQLLVQTPQCPVQQLLAAALALPDGKDGDGAGGSGQTRWLCSHPLARNSALRLLHVLCVSKDVPPSAQLLFSQCPALLWRVLKLAAALCKGVAVANAALVRRALADYVMASAQPSTGGAVGATLTPVQVLLRSNKAALSSFFSSTYAVWGCRGGGAGGTREDSGGDCAEAATDAVYAEEDLQRAVQMLQV